ncbi:MAG: DUF4352 domain-containing protein [Anaerolineales bacterium]|nr:DUF4352 domain-containing protein [Anaerolineales bacterium]MCB8987721.1 DUF4352 domain-containing protein [Ardenticatenaceae bacterium]
MMPELEPEEIEQERPQTRPLMSWVTANRWLAVFIGIVVLGVIALCVIAVLMLLSFFQGNSLLGGGAEPTPFPTAVGSVLTNQEPLVVGVSPSETISVTLDMPATLTLRGQSFTVQPQVIGADGVWTPDIEEGSAAWVFGTIVNYVFGLPDTADMRTLLEQLDVGDEIEMVTQSGMTYTFSFNSREEVAPNNRDIYTQQVPGTTIVLVGNRNENRLVVNGRYVVSDTAGNIQANTVELGEPVQLGDLQVTVTGSAYDPSRSEAPAGFAYFRIDYQVQNVGLTAVDTSDLRLMLTDDLGNQYALSPVASQLGNFPMLSGFLNAGQSVQATAGYQIPTGLNSQTVQWVVVDTGSGAQIQVVIPYAGGSNALANTSISLVDAVISADQISLILQGQITNLGEQPVVVTESDLSLRTTDGSQFLLLATNPAFPWTVPPGQTLQFYVTYQRPPADTFIFTVLNQPFQLTLVR